MDKPSTSEVPSDPLVPLAPFEETRQFAESSILGAAVAIGEVPSVADEPVFVRRRTRCFSCGQVVRAGRDVQPALRWSSEPPTVTPRTVDHYWHRSHGDINMVMVAMDDGRLVDADDGEPVDEMGGEWSGPIPLPQETLQS